jgi:hypothetical protein
MIEPLSDFECYVAKYRVDAALPPNEDLDPEPSNMPQLVQVGPAKLSKPKPEALSYAVQLLLQTKMPKWHDASIERHVELRKRFGVGEAAASNPAYKAAAREPIELDAEEFSKLERNVLKIARAIGMLHSDMAPLDGWNESLLEWIKLAHWIQSIFKIEKTVPAELGPQSVGTLQILLSPGSLQIRPAVTYDALVYRAAQMVAHGTTARTCDKCGKPFLEGGERANDNRKRSGSRFCSDKCRYEYHNEARRKDKATKS